MQSSSCSLIRYRRSQLHPFVHITPVQMERTYEYQGTKGYPFIYPTYQETILS